MTPELLQDARAIIGEGPIWDDRSRRLHWVDIPAGLVHRFSPSDGSDEVVDVGQPVGSVGLGASGGLVLALRDGFGLIPQGSQWVQQLVEVEKEVAGNRMNDGRCDAAGRFWAGTMSWEHKAGAGCLYCLEEIGGRLTSRPVLPGVTVANGIDWSPDGKLLYYIDSPTQRVDVFDFHVAEGTISNRRVFVDIPAAEGLPDGMVVDAEGCVWVALFRGGRLRRYTPAGSADVEVELPVTLVTSASFGGDDLGDLFITTARHRLTPEQADEQVHAGSLFGCRPGVKGRPANRFCWI